MSFDFSAARGWFSLRRAELLRAAEERAAEERAARNAKREAAAREARREAAREARRRARNAPRSHAMVTRGQVRALLSPVPAGASASPAGPRVREAVAAMHGLGRCARCGVVRSALEFSSNSRMRECLPCAMAEHDADPLGCFANGLVRDARARALKTGIPIDIDAAWVRSSFEASGGACALCGRPMRLERAKQRPRSKARSFFRFPWNASLDQREPRAGYTRTNTQLAHLRCNLAKADTPQTEFAEMCAAVAAHLAAKSKSNG